MAAPSSPSSDDPFAIGSVLDDRYRIEAVLGTGGMGRVYRAEHTKIGKSVAIKVLHADLTRNREASQRFQREAIASGRLDHGLSCSRPKRSSGASPSARPIGYVSRPRRLSQSWRC